MKFFKRIFIFVLFISPILGLSQECSPINAYYPEDYGADAQNWSISQDQNKFIYVANNKGLLEYNGFKWKLYETPNNSVMRTVKVIDNVIYTGNYHDFGFWDRDDYGVLHYTSLSKKLNINFEVDEEFWGVVSVGSTLIFQSLDRLHVYNLKTKKYSVVTPENGISRMFKVNNQIYFNTYKKGLYKLVEGKPVQICDNLVLDNQLVINMFEVDGRILAVTEKNGLFELGQKKLLPWNEETNNELKNHTLYSAIKLENGEFILGTISNGIIKLSKNGSVVSKIGQANGLTSSTILSVFEDVNKNIWLGLNEGINCINTKSPFRSYFDSKESLGSVYVSKVFNNILYLGTNQGLFYRPLNIRSQSFKKIEGTQGQVWFLDVLYGKLFCGHNKGTFEIIGDSAKMISTIEGTWLIKTISKNSNLLLQGNYDGLNVLEFKNGEWHFRNKVRNFETSTRYFEFLDDHNILVNHEYKGVFRIKLNKDYTEAISVVKDISAPKGLYSSLVKYEGDIYYAYKEGVLKFDAISRVFKKDSLFSSLISPKDFSSAKLVTDSKNNQLWAFNKTSLRYLTTSSISGAKTVASIAFPYQLRKDIVGFESVMLLGGFEYLFGSRNGYYILNLNDVPKNSYKIVLNEVLVGLLKNENDLNPVKLNVKGAFKNDEHNLNFSFSIPDYHSFNKPEYSYKLEGIYDSWSEWSSSGNLFFENLPYGTYTFKVKGRIGKTETENIATYTFKIAKPWYLSLPMVVIYFLFIIGILLVMNQVYRSHYKKQQKRYLKKKHRELALKELESKQQLMKLKNENLQQEIENKSRELGISTMSLIKKNETLNELRKVINAIQDLKELKKVNKIIDENLSDTNDWKVFEEAFNNADKDFLKKMKSMHPELTSNDLRLCTYLRLNLSSKEIAPLLNISFKSVEVKRYRLRKKLNLEHEDGLSEYILQV